MHKRLYTLLLTFVCFVPARASIIYDQSGGDLRSLMTTERCKYVIRHHHVFEDTLKIPNGSELRFEGGSLKGPIVFQDNKISGAAHFQGSSVSGTIRNKVVDASWFCEMDGKTDDAPIINQLIEACDNIFFPNGVYRLISSYNPTGKVDSKYHQSINCHLGISKSNIVLKGEDGTEFITDEPIGMICIFSKPNQIALSIGNIEINKIQFSVNNDGVHFNEFLHTIKVIGVNGLLIEYCYFNDFWGDAICLSHYGDNPQTGERTRNQNVKILNNTIVGGDSFNNRNGISVINGEEVLIKNNFIKNTSRKDMPGGIDIEPNNSAYTIESIRIENNTLEGIKGSGGAICVVAQNGGPAHNIYIIKNRVSRSNTGIFIYLKTDYTTDNYIIKNNVIESDTQPYRFEGKGVSQRWEVTGNSFMRPCKQPFLGEMTVEGLVMRKNVKKKI